MTYDQIESYATDCGISYLRTAYTTYNTPMYLKSKIDPVAQAKFEVYDQGADTALDSLVSEDLAGPEVWEDPKAVQAAQNGIQFAIDVWVPPATGGRP